MPDEVIEDLPPSSKLVLMVLDDEDELSRGEICDETNLPKSTARYALDRLVEEDVVDVGIDDTDGRRLTYTLDGAEGSDT